ncbi:MAG: type II secretion system F family protein [Deltaproteobacteria bacterium]|nr:type II secretion system F family protein [Deltaproteobacteria bacterium]
MDAFDPDEVRQRLANLGYSEVELRRKWFELPRLTDVLGLVTRIDRAVVARQLSVMLDAALPAAQCVSIIKGQQRNRSVRRELELIEAGLARGLALADALRLAHRLFAAAPEFVGVSDEDVVNALERFARRVERRG